MRRIARLGMVLAILLCALVSSSAPSNSVVPVAHKTAHKIVFHALTGDSSACSATAVGPHALLTATHCLQPTDLVQIDGREARIAEIIGDSVDHSILLLDGHDFADYAAFARRSKLEPGDDIFLFGNPGPYVDMFRKGYVAGYAAPNGVNLSELLLGIKHRVSAVQVVYFDFNGFFGDSGSAIFNSEGHIVGVTSFISSAEAHGVTTRYMGGYELRFTPRQIRYAREFQ